MPLLAPTTDRLVSLPATLGVSPRLVGGWLAARTDLAGVVVVVSDGGRGRFAYAGPVQWWLQLKAPCTLTVDGRTIAVRVRGHRVAADLVEVDFAGPADVPLTSSSARARIEAQDRLDVELGAYWSGRPEAPVGTEGQSRLEAVSTALDTSELPMYVLGPDGTYLGVNQPFLDRARRRLDEVIGRSPSAVWTGGRSVPVAAAERTVELPGVGSAVIGSLAGGSGGVLGGGVGGSGAPATR
ncbi:MAG: hypothetical protein AAGA59_02240 [Actinomycetota bacterium]